MSNVNVYLNKTEVVDVCTRLKCTDGDLPKVTKAILTGATTSKHFRDLGTKQVEQEPVDKEAIIDEYLLNTDIGVMSLRKSGLLTKPKFTPN